MTMGTKMVKTSTASSQKVLFAAWMSQRDSSFAASKRRRAELINQTKLSHRHRAVLALGGRFGRIQQSFLNYDRSSAETVIMYLP